MLTPVSMPSTAEDAKLISFVVTFRILEYHIPIRMIAVMAPNYNQYSRNCFPLLLSLIEHLLENNLMPLLICQNPQKKGTVPSKRVSSLPSFAPLSLFFVQTRIRQMGADNTMHHLKSHQDEHSQSYLVRSVIKLTVPPFFFSVCICNREKGYQ